MMEHREVKALVSLLNDDDPHIVSQIEAKIFAIGALVIPHLEQEWEYSISPTVQKRIEKLIHTLHYERVKTRLKEWYKNNSEDLLTGMWIVATYQYPHVELQKLQKEIDKIDQAIRPKFCADLAPFTQVKIINSILFDKLKFGANSRDFHSPGNSLLNTTLETRKGNPVTLSVIYILIAQRLNLPIYGVNFPNLFMLIYKSSQHKPFYINAFNHGIIFSRQEVENYIAELQIPLQDSFFEPCNPSEIIRRALRNLIVSCEKMGEHIKANEVKVLLTEAVEGEA